MMITNTVLLKLKDRSAEKLEEAKAVLLGMRGKIDSLADIRVELNIRPGPSAYDILMATTFKSMADMEAYLKHPAHLEVGRYIGGVLETQAAVCYGG